MASAITINKWNEMKLKLDKKNNLHRRFGSFV